MVFVNYGGGGYWWLDHSRFARPLFPSVYYLSLFVARSHSLSPLVYLHFSLPPPLSLSVPLPLSLCLPLPAPSPPSPRPTTPFSSRKTLVVTLLMLMMMLFLAGNQLVSVGVSCICAQMERSDGGGLGVPLVRPCDPFVGLRVPRNWWIVLHNYNVCSCVLSGLACLDVAPCGCVTHNQVHVDDGRVHGTVSESTGASRRIEAGHVRQDHRPVHQALLHRSVPEQRRRHGQLACSGRAAGRCRRVRVPPQHVSVAVAVMIRQRTSSPSRLSSVRVYTVAVLWHRVLCERPGGDLVSEDLLGRLECVTQRGDAPAPHVRQLRSEARREAASQLPGSRPC